MLFRKRERIRVLTVNPTYWSSKPCPPAPKTRSNPLFASHFCYHRLHSWKPEETPNLRKETIENSQQDSCPQTKKERHGFRHKKYCMKNDKRRFLHPRSFISSLKGLVQETPTTLRILRLSLSSGATYRLSPVCFRRRRALRLRSTGAYVSGTKSRSATYCAPDQIRSTHHVQRHETC
jgi:hypothetical protein